MFTQLGLNARQERWMAFLSEFNFEVKHIKGKEIGWLMDSVKEIMKWMRLL